MLLAERVGIPLAAIDLAPYFSIASLPFLISTTQDGENSCKRNVPSIFVLFCAHCSLRKSSISTMLLSLARRARGNPLILACLLVSFIAFYKSIHKFHLSTISRVSYPYFNHTKELLLLQSPEPIPIPRPQNEVPLSCPEPTCPPQLQCPPYIPSQLNTTITKASACPDNFSPASTSPPASSQFPGKPTKEQETIAKLRNEGIVIIL